MTFLSKSNLAIVLRCYLIISAKLLSSILTLGHPHPHPYYFHHHHHHHLPQLSKRGRNIYHITPIMASSTIPSLFCMSLIIYTLFGPSSPTSSSLHHCLLVGPIMVLSLINLHAHVLSLQNFKHLVLFFLALYLRS